MSDSEEFFERTKENSITFNIGAKPEKVDFTNKPKFDTITNLGKDKRPKDALLQQSPGISSAYNIGCHSFVKACILAYNDHHHLILKPDDLWIAILSQFSNYVNLHSEKLRNKFVEHEGQKELEVVCGGTLRTAPYDLLTKMMSDSIAKNIKDPSIRDWAVPSFSTSTETDRIVGIVMLMATFKNYFAYKFSLRCGLPQVTLLGTIEDWEQLKVKTQRLLEFDTGDKYMHQWLDMLNPVLDKFIDSSKGKVDTYFWMRIASFQGGGSGPTYLSGWITVFTVFDDSGKWVDKQKKKQSIRGTLETEWFFIDSQNIPVGYAFAPVTIDDNGTIYKSEIYAGHMAADILNENTIQPRLDWALLLKE
ncbi:hypothetical protein DLAC_05271 [Tieghemostelium lacteum]|uniref:DUF4419 domain-containing protein n=1 Tax=Tieghemostelium lacteum TaxID=361077 RepID=A0A151ZIQ4_TIELA|nr:hypothetical protein DLAC_05271 [Tieghemostelium lacteum]|eukprot:KYQ93872.1 hypothetical protein DLAC_05271 [Tieghemostelium lacteum]